MFAFVVGAARGGARFGGWIRTHVELANVSVSPVAVDDRVNQLALPWWRGGRDHPGNVRSEHVFVVVSETCERITMVRLL